MDRSNMKDMADIGLLRLPNEIFLEIFQQLDSADFGIFSLSTSCRRLHYLALPIYLAAYGITDATALADQDMVLSPTQLDVLRALQTSLFIHSLKHISVSFSLNSARRDYSPRDMDIFFRHIRGLAAFLSILDEVKEVTLDFKDVNFWAITESPAVLERWSPIVSTLLTVVLEKGCNAFNVEGGIFIVHPSQFQLKAGPRAAGKRRTVMSDVGRRLGSHFAGRSGIQQVSDSRTTRAALRTFNIQSRVLLLHPCYAWTIAALNTSPNLRSLSIVRVDIPERSWGEILSSIHVPALEDLTLDLRCRIRAPAFDQFLARHPRIHTLSLGRNLLPLEDGDVASRDCLPNLRHLTASPSYVHFLMTDRRAPAVESLRLLVKVASNAVFNAGSINRVLASCHARIARVHLTLVIVVDYASSHWTGFFPEEESTGLRTTRAAPDSLRCARALEVTASYPSGAFEALALRLLPAFPALHSLSFSGCLRRGASASDFVVRVKEACPEIQQVMLDGETYDVAP